ncbi:MAG: ribosome maturation factor RimP [Deltaproteobacteria bacterium]|nr:ribosome maturation factor RimP [Deltaproteobacteria bacterium]
MDYQHRQKIIQVIQPVVEEQNCDLVEVEVAIEHSVKVLRVYIDKIGGVQLEDCAHVSHAIEDLIEAEELVAGRYSLEVTSPGLNRPLRTKSHFEEVVGKQIKVVTRDKINGRKNYRGTLNAVDESDLLIEIDGEEYRVPIAELAKGRLLAQDI